MFDKRYYPSTGQSWAEAPWRTLSLNRQWGLTDTKFAGLFLCSDLSPPVTSKDEDKVILCLCCEGVEIWGFLLFNLHRAQLAISRTKKGYIGLSHP